MIQYLCGRNISSLVIMVQKTNFCLHLWHLLIQLPDNHAAYGTRVDKGTPPSYEKLHETYSIKSQKLLRVLQRYSMVIG
jgi:hypothetical protein